MASIENERESVNEGGNWWGGWINSVKEKSANAVDFVKRDLADFSQTMQTDTKKVVTDAKDKLKQENASAVTGKVKTGISSFLGSLAQALTVEEEEEEEPTKITKTESPIFDKSKARLAAIQLDPGTYLQEPSSDKNLFDEWLKTFNVDNKKGEISELLVSKTEVRSIYTQLVPAEISNAVFWQHYFYKVHRLKLDEERRENLKKRAEVVQNEDEDELDWDDFDTPSPPDSSEVSTDINSVNERLQGTDTETESDNEKNRNNDNENLLSESKISDSFCDPTKSVITDTDSSEKPESETLVVPAQDTSRLHERVKGDMVVVGVGSATPSTTGSSNSKDSLEDDWEKEFDLEVTEEDIISAQQAVKNIEVNEGDKNDWEDWE